MKDLERLQIKVEKLLKAYYALQEEAMALKKGISEKDEAIKLLNEKNKQLEDAVKQKSFDKYFHGLSDDQKNQIKSQIDVILEMIDNNIKLLN